VDVRRLALAGRLEDGWVGRDRHALLPRCRIKTSARPADARRDQLGRPVGRFDETVGRCLRSELGRLSVR
jgi:hypothetical protein